jgi:hypothetical protein
MLPVGPRGQTNKQVGLYSHGIYCRNPVQKLQLGVVVLRFNSRAATDRPTDHKATQKPSFDTRYRFDESCVSDDWKYLHACNKARLSVALLRQAAVTTVAVSCNLAACVSLTANASAVLAASRTANSAARVEVSFLGIHLDFELLNF